MLNSFRIILLSTGAAVVSHAVAAPVARVISARPVNVNGILAPARNFVPLSLGNEVTTDAASAVIQFTNGTSVTLQPHSTLRIEAEPSGPVARVLVLEKVSRRKEGRRPKSLKVHSVWHGGFLYAIVRDEWKAAKETV